MHIIHVHKILYVHFCTHMACIVLGISMNIKMDDGRISPVILFFCVWMWMVYVHSGSGFSGHGITLSKFKWIKYIIIKCLKSWKIIRKLYSILMVDHEKNWRGVVGSGLACRLQTSHSAAQQPNRTGSKWSQVTVSNLQDWQQVAASSSVNLPLCHRAVHRKPIRQSLELWRPQVTPTDGCPSCSPRGGNAWWFLPQISVAFGNGELLTNAGGRFKKWRSLRVISAWVKCWNLRFSEVNLQAEWDHYALVLILSYLLSWLKKLQMGCDNFIFF